MPAPSPLSDRSFLLFISTAALSLCLGVILLAYVMLAELQIPLSAVPYEIGAVPPRIASPALELIVSGALCLIVWPIAALVFWGRRIFACAVDQAPDGALSTVSPESESDALTTASSSSTTSATSTASKPITSVHVQA